LRSECGWECGPIGAVGPAPARAQAQFVSGVHLIEVYVTVTDRDGHPVTGLTKQDFTVYENEQPQELSVFTAGEVGLSVAVALDHSFSMAGERLDMMKRATETFSMRLAAHRSGDADRHRQTVEVLAPLSTIAPRSIRPSTARRLRSTSLRDALVTRWIGSSRRQAGAPRAALRRRRSLSRPAKPTSSIARATATCSRIRSRWPTSAAPPSFVDLAIATGGHSLQLTDPRRLGDHSSPASTSCANSICSLPPRRASPDRPEWRGLRVTVARAGATVRARPAIGPGNR